MQHPNVPKSVAEQSAVDNGIGPGSDHYSIEILGLVQKASTPHPKRSLANLCCFTKFYPSALGACSTSAVLPSLPKTACL